MDWSSAAPCRADRGQHLQAVKRRGTAAVWLTLRTRRFSMASAAKTRSPTAESSIFHARTKLPVCVCLSPDDKLCCLLGPTTAKLCVRRQTHTLTHTHTYTHSTTATAAAAAAAAAARPACCLSRGRGQPLWSSWQRQRHARGCKEPRAALSSHHPCVMTGGAMITPPWTQGNLPSLRYN